MIVAVVALVATTAILLVRFVNRVPTPQEHARKNATCMATLDTECLWNLMNSREKAAAGITKDQFAQIVSKVRDKVGTLQVVLTSEPEEYSDQTSVYVSAKSSEGREFIVSMVAEHGNPPVTAQMLSNLVQMPFYMERKNGRPLRRKSESSKMYLQFCRAEIEPIGLKGLPTGPHYKLQTWAELEKIFGVMW